MTHQRDKAHFWGAVWVLGATTIVVFLWLLLRFGGDRVTAGVDDVSELVAALVAGGACFVAARRVSPARGAWRLLGLSSLSWAAGEAIWCYYDLVRNVTVPFPSPADAGYLLAVPLAVAGLLRLPGGAIVTTSRFRSLLDGLLIGGALFFVSWSTVLGPIFDQHHGSVFKQTIGLAYPVSDVIMASLALMLATRPGRQNRVSLGLVLAGVLAFAVADSSFAYLTEVNDYGIGNALDTGWVAGYLLIALGALWARANPEAVVPKEAKATKWTVLGPYLPLVAAGATFLWRVASAHQAGLVSDLVGMGLVCVVSVRQVVLLMDNMALNDQLEARIQERTAELHHQALHDGLTGLANRALFNEYLASAVRRRGRSGVALSVLFIDLDGFKRVNDLHGHVVGDKVLQEVSRRFERTLRAADTIARLGGDEFAVLLEHEPSASDPATVAGRLLDSLADPIRVGSIRLTVRSSIGVATDRSNVESADELLRNADLAMYTAKAKATHSYEMYAPDMHSALLERMRTEAELNSALSHGQFLLHYQPVVGVDSGAMEGVEALIRWNHPRRGLLLPDEFIPAAETSGLIVPIGAWVLREACRQMQQWHEETGFDSLSLSVNLSRRQVADEGLYDTVAAALGESGFEPRRLVLEVTESVIMDDLPYAVSVMERLRSLGVKIAIDDFGTGYSSLSALRDLPVDTLKIDKSFVAAIAVNKGAADVTQRILQLAADFHLHTVAEGVEEREQLEALRRLGCESVQGFYYAHPLPADDVEASLMWAAPERSSGTGLGA